MRKSILHLPHHQVLAHSVPVLGVRTYRKSFVKLSPKNYARSRYQPFSAVILTAKNGVLTSLSFWLNWIATAHILSDSSTQPCPSASADPNETARREMTYCRDGQRTRIVLTLLSKEGRSDGESQSAKYRIGSRLRTYDRSLRVLRASAQQKDCKAAEADQSDR